MDANPVIRLMIISDVIWTSGTGLLAPIFALFLVDAIPGADVTVAGIAASIYLVTKSIAQIPAASIIDRIRGERDDFAFMFIGSLLASLIPLAYLIVTSPEQLYIVQFLYGACVALTTPSYMAIFTRHIDKHKEGTEWGIYQTPVDLGSAIAASIGGVIALTVSYQALIIAVVGMSIIGVTFLLPVRFSLYKRT